MTTKANETKTPEEKKDIKGIPNKPTTPPPPPAPKKETEPKAAKPKATEPKPEPRAAEKKGPINQAFEDLIQALAEKESELRNKGRGHRIYYFTRTRVEQTYALYKRSTK